MLSVVAGMVSMESRLVGLLRNFSTSLERFEAAAVRQLVDFFGCDDAHFATLGPRFVESSPPYFQRILADPERFDPGQQKAREIVANVGPAFIDTEVYSSRERDRLPIFRELLRPAGISSVVLAAVQLAGRTTGMIHLVRDGRPFRSDALTQAAPLLNMIAIMHHALVGMPAGAPSMPPETAAHALARLTPREHEVATLAAGGYGALQIAARLGTSIHTVRRQLEAVYRKCGIGNRAELATLIQRATLSPDALPTSSALHRGLTRIFDSAGLRVTVHPDLWRDLA